MKALRRYRPQIDLQQERVPEEVLERLEIIMDDFTNAFREVTPSELREVYVEVPNIKWEDIGGLEEIKQELVEAIEWPLNYSERFKRSA